MAESFQIYFLSAVTSLYNLGCNNVMNYFKIVNRDEGPWFYAFIFIWFFENQDCRYHFLFLFYPPSSPFHERPSLIYMGILTSLTLQTSNEHNFFLLDSLFQLIPLKTNKYHQLFLKNMNYGQYKHKISSLKIKQLKQFHKYIFVLMNEYNYLYLYSITNNNNNNYLLNQSP